jgi:hypothetical protein
MRDHLLDLVQHTFDLGCIDLVKITGDAERTTIRGLAENKSVVVEGEFAVPVAEFVGQFGMPNLGKLKILLNLPEYKENAKITLTRKANNQPDGVAFENETGDFKNTYRFMESAIVNSKLVDLVFTGVKWHVDFEPTVASIMRLKSQAQANAEEPTFQARTVNGDLKFNFGDHSTHAGEFIFQPGVNGVLKRAWSWPVVQIMSILNLVGDKRMHISDDGCAKITVNSGLAVYDYILPAQSK